MLRDLRAMPPAAKTQLSSEVLETLNPLAAAPTHAAANVNTGMGFAVDAALLLKRGTAKPVPVANMDLMDDSTLPEDAEKCCVMSATYHDCLLDGRESGLMALEARLMEARNFRVVRVSYKDMAQASGKLDRVKKLDQKLQDAVSK